MSTPHFLHQFYERARRGRSAFERHQAAFLAWEYGLRMLASVALVEYAERATPDSKLAPALQNLACPSLGHWWEIVRLLVPRLADDGDSGFQRVQALLLGKNRDDLLECIRLDAALQKALYKDAAPVARQAVSLREMSDRLVAYRNSQYHASIGLREDERYTEMTAPLLEGVGRLWRSVDVLAGRQLIYVDEVRRLATGDWRIDQWDLSQEQPEARHADVAHAQVANLPLANRLYVAAREPGVSGAWEGRVWRLLFPLALYEREQRELFLYGSANQRKAKVAYVGCISGEHVQKVEGPEQLRLLSRLLQTSVSEEQLERWAEHSQADTATSIPIPESQERRRLGEFTLLSRLGQGAAGTVYRAWQPSLQRIVAVKRLLRANDTKAQERFLREIRALGRVRHPHLVEAYNGGTEGEDAYFAMELVEGADLGRVIEQLAGSDVGRVDSRAWQTAVSSAHASARAQEQPLSDDEATSFSAVARESAVADAAARFSHGHVRHVVEMLRDVADAVQALHDKQIVHRDIKPGNIMVTPAGDAVLTDLGLAQLQDADTITKSKQFVGTVRYSSPEQIFDASRVDFRSDVYSLGATLWELLTLRPLLGITQELPVDEAFRRIRRDEPESVRKYNPQVPDDLARVIAKCLRKDETQRYRTAAELSADLTRWLAGEPVLADNPTLGYLLSKALRRHAKPIAAAATLLTVLLAVFVGAFVAVNQARRAAVETGRELKTARDDLDTALKNARTALKGEELANAQLAKELVARNDETAKVLFASGCLKYEMGRIQEGKQELARAYKRMSKDNPLSSSYLRILLDRLHLDRSDLLPHAAAVWAVSFSPDGTRVVTASEDQTARLWDALTGRPIGDAMRHGSEVRAVAFSPDGTRVVTGSRDKTARLWDALTGKPVGDAMRHEDDVLSVAFSPDGTHVVTGSEDQTAHFWDALTGKPVGDAMRHEGRVNAIAFSPDGTRIVTGSGDRTARLWDALTCKPVGEAMRHEGAVASVAFSPDGTRVVTGSVDPPARLWDALTGKLVSDALRHEGYVVSVAFSPDGTRIVTGSWDGTARLWDARTGKPVGYAMRHEGEVFSVAFSPDGMRVVTGCGDNTARLWDALTGTLVSEALRHEGEIFSVAFSPDGTRVVTGSKDSTARLWDAPTGKPVGNAMRHKESVDAVAFSPDGTRVVTGSKDSTARLWDALTGKPVGDFMLHEGAVISVAFSPDGTRVATGSRDNTARLWDALTSKPVGDVMRHTGSVATVAFSPDGTRVVTASLDQTARLWDAQTGKPVGNVMRHESYVDAVAFSPDGTRVATGSSDHTASLWDALAGTPVGDAMRHEDSVIAVAFSPDGTRVATGSSDNTARLWDGQTGKPVGDAMRHEKTVRAVAFSPDGTRVMTGSSDKTARLWDALTGKPVGDALRQEDDMLSVAFSPDGTRVVTTWDDTARLWDALTGKPVGDAMRHERRVTAVAFSPDGTRVVTGSWDGTARLWDARVTPAPRQIDVWIDSRMRGEFDGNGPFTPFSYKVLTSRFATLNADDTWLANLAKDRRTRQHNSHVLMLESAAAKEYWFAAVFHAQWLTQHEPENSERWENLAEAHAEQDRWKEARTSFRKLVELEPDNIDWLHAAGLIDLADNDLPDFQQQVNSMLLVAGRNEHNEKWNSTPYLASLSNSTELPRAQLLDLARKAVSSAPDSWPYRETLGASLYRSDEFEAAVTELSRAIDLRAKPEKKDKPTDSESPPATGSYFTHAFLVLANYRLNKLDEVNRHRKILTQIAYKSPPEDWWLGILTQTAPKSPRESWQERVRRRILDAEILAVCGPSKATDDREKDE